MKKIFKPVLLALLAVPFLSGCGSSGPREITMASFNYDMFIDIEAKDNALGTNHQLAVSVRSKNPEFEFSGNLCYTEVQVQYYYKNNDEEVGKTSYCNFTITLDSSGNGSSGDARSSGITSPTCDVLNIISAEPLLGRVSATVKVPAGDSTDYSSPDHRVTFKNYDGTLLYETTVEDGGSVQYKGETPTKPSYQYTDYVFSGWGNDLSSIRQSMTLVAHYTEQKNQDDPAYTNAEFTFKKVTGGYELSKFSTIKSYEDIIIPAIYNGEPVISIGKEAFYKKTNFYGIKFVGTNLKTIGEGAFQKCNIIRHLTLPEGLETIEKDAFNDVYNIKGITFPSTLKTIGDYAFEGVGWRSPMGNFDITIPKAVTKVGKMAFYSCDAITTIYCKATSRPSGWDSYWAVKDGYYSSIYSSDYTYHNVVWGA